MTELASLLGAFRNAPVVGLDPARTSASLIALLPRARDRAPLMLKALVQAAPTKYPAAVSTLLTLLTYMVFMLIGQWLMGSLQAHRPIEPPPTSTPTIDSPSAPASSERPQSPVR